MTGSDGAHSFDHVLGVMFENRSFDRLSGHPYGPGRWRRSKGVLGRDLSNPIQVTHRRPSVAWCRVHGATSMDAPNPDAGEEHPHTNTQLFGTVAPENNRFVSYEQMMPPFNADRRTTISLGPTNRW